MHKDKATPGGGEAGETRRYYVRRREELVEERDRPSRRRVGLEDALRRMDIIGASTEDDLRYTMRNLGDEHAAELRQKLVQLDSLREDAKNSVRRQLDEAEERERELTKRIGELDEEFELSQQRVGRTPVTRWRAAAHIALGLPPWRPGDGRGDPDARPPCRTCSWWPTSSPSSRRRSRSLWTA
ncbi:hypothetical protein [Olsenella sp. Marseille-P4559]|uniref:hypothetical protein n=1 Tax=Olsenella sp. Marseille-P4559 TaxID=2364795 RepID=UPI0013EF4C08|nr:hypothetical protein [Olsenella sp. Marseille-P4559]